MTTTPKTLEDLIREGIIILSPEELAEIGRTKDQIKNSVRVLEEDAAIDKVFASL